MEFSIGNEPEVVQYWRVRSVLGWLVYILAPWWGAALLRRRTVWTLGYAVAMYLTLFVYWVILSGVRRGWP